MMVPSNLRRVRDKGRATTTRSDTMSPLEAEPWNSNYNKWECCEEGDSIAQAPCAHPTKIGLRTSFMHAKIVEASHGTLIDQARNRCPLQSFVFAINPEVSLQQATGQDIHKTTTHVHQEQSAGPQMQPWGGRSWGRRCSGLWPELMDNGYENEKFQFNFNVRTP